MSAAGEHAKLIRAKHVDADRLIWMILEHGHVLVGGGVKDDLWPRLLEEALHAGLIGDVTDACLQSRLRVLIVYALGEIKQPRLVII